MTEEQASRLSMLQSDLEHKKRVYDTYLDVLVEYNITATAYAAIMYDNLFFENLQRLDTEDFIDSLLIKSPPIELSEEQKIEEKIKDYDRLIGLVENRIRGFPKPIQKRIAKDSIEHEASVHYLWNREKKQRVD